ncbi:unnamed protein product [Adineta steineri]|uniref:Uncharacterized protein n=1 Tax=Adineta steineri TaxID=433720 RepID=A0A813ULT8_9BILA|nr:unnamed protein product [Adineta steineri]
MIMQYFTVLLLLFSTSSMFVSSLQCLSCKQDIVVNYIVTSETVPSFSGCEIVEGRRCYIRVFWNKNVNSTQLTINGFFFASKKNTVDLTGDVSAAIITRVLPDQESPILENVVIWSCHTGDKCNDENSLKQILRSLVIEDQFRKEISPILKVISPFDAKSAECFEFQNETYCDRTQINECQRCYGDVTRYDPFHTGDMATITYTQTRKAAVAANDDSKVITHDYQHVIHTVGAGMRDIVRTSSEVLVEFQDALKPLLSLLSPDHQNQIYDTFIEYHKLLMASQKFLTRALILAARARTAKELIESINIQTIRDMCSNVEVLIEKFLKLNPILEEKLKYQQTLKRWRNILGLLTIIGTCAFGIGMVYGLYSSTGFTKDIKAFLVSTGVITIAAGAPTIVAHVAQHEAELNHMKMALKDIRNVLSKLSQNYPQIEEMAQILADDDNTRQDFIQLLKETQTEVNKGFELLRQL